MSKLTKSMFLILGAVGLVSSREDDFGEKDLEAIGRSDFAKQAIVAEAARGVAKENGFSEAFSTSTATGDMSGGVDASVGAAVVAPEDPGTVARTGHSQVVPAYPTQSPQNSYDYLKWPPAVQPPRLPEFTEDMSGGNDADEVEENPEVYEDYFEPYKPTPEEAAEAYVAELVTHLQKMAKYVRVPDSELPLGYLLEKKNQTILKFFCINPDSSDPSLLQNLAKQPWIEKPKSSFLNSQCYIAGCRKYGMGCAGGHFGSSEITELNKASKDKEHAFCAHHRSWFQALKDVPKADLDAAIAMVKSEDDA